MTTNTRPEGQEIPPLPERNALAKLGKIEALLSRSAKLDRVRMLGRWADDYLSTIRAAIAAHEARKVQAEPAPDASSESGAGERKLPENAREWTDSESAAFRQGWSFGRKEGLRVALSTRDAASERALDEEIANRDRAEEWADKLADAIATLTGAEIGEHTSANDPWRNALEAAQEAEDFRKTTDALAASERAAPDAQAETTVDVNSGMDALPANGPASDSDRAVYQSIADRYWRDDKRDAERLGWLEATYNKAGTVTFSRVRRIDEDKARCVVSIPGKDDMVDIVREPTLRAAIDAAMQATKETGHE